MRGEVVVVVVVVVVEVVRGVVQRRADAGLAGRRVRRLLLGRRDGRALSTTLARTLLQATRTLPIGVVDDVDPRFTGGFDARPTDDVGARGAGVEGALGGLERCVTNVTTRAGGLAHELATIKDLERRKMSSSSSDSDCIDCC